MGTMWKVIGFLPLCLLAIFPLTASAQQDFEIVKGGCLPDVVNDDGEEALARGAQPQRLPALYTDWNPEKTYHQMVILIEFSDSVFSMEDPAAFYNKILNEPGYNEGNGLGCAADYLRSQSGGLANFHFDVFGPVRVGQKAQPYSDPNSNTKNYPRDSYAEATQKVLQDNPNLDYSIYDWNGNGNINQVVYITASLSGNTGSKSYGFPWPHTSTLNATITTPDGLKIRQYSASAELLPTTPFRSCGIGTICHEFSHSLGLPDIYPTKSSGGYSVCDEWDLMDGGNFTNYGWCPSNYSAMERMLLGWLTPVELTEPASITDLEPVEYGGNAYIIRHTDTEFLMLENRQWKGWDLGVPGKGLVIYHVNYNSSVWTNNSLNNDPTQRGFDLVHADNMNYVEWDNYRSKMGYSKYQNSNRMNSRILSTSPYPWRTDSAEAALDSLTDFSVPATVMFTANTQDSKLLSKPITNITVSENGLVSFDFMGGVPKPDGIKLHHSLSIATHPSIYDLQGRNMNLQNRKGVYLVRREDGTVRKIFK